MRHCLAITARPVCVEAGFAVVQGVELVEDQVVRTGQVAALVVPPRSKAGIAGVLDPGIPIV